MVSYILKRIFRLVMGQKKYLSRFSKSNQNEIVLYNEKLQKSKSLIIHFDDTNKKLYQSNEIKAIRSDNSRIFFVFNTNCLVFYSDGEQAVPVIEEVSKEDEIPAIGFTDLFIWYAKSKDSGGTDVGQRGVRLGRLDAANEAGFFHRTERSRLKEIKKKLKDKGTGEPTEPKKTE